MPYGLCFPKAGFVATMTLTGSGAITVDKAMLPFQSHLSISLSSTLLA